MKLKPCPFCGERIEVELKRLAYSSTQRNGINYVLCRSCNATGPYGEYSGEGAELWNDRHKEATDEESA